MFFSLGSQNNGVMYGANTIEKITPLGPPDANRNIQVEVRFSSGTVESFTIHESEAEQFDRFCQHVHFNVIS